MTSAFGRYLLLLDLRRRLLFRGPSRGSFAGFVMVVVALQAVGFGLAAAWFTFHLASAPPGGALHPDVAPNLARILFVGIFAFQLSVGALGVAVGDFYDTSRLLHLPVGPREIFGAMSTASLFTPTTLFLAAPAVGLAAAISDGAGPFVARLAIFLLSAWFGHLAALALGFFFLRLYSKRRLRDLATIVGAGIGLAIFLAFRSLGGAAGGGLGSDSGLEALQTWLVDDVWRSIDAAPSQWFAVAFADLESRPGRAALGVLGGVAACLVLLRLGSAAFRLTYDAAGTAGGGEGAVKEVRAGWSRLLPPDLAAVVGATYATLRREPQLRALLWQQLIFLGAPVVLQASDGRGGSAAGAEAFFYMAPLMVVLSHSAISLSLFGFDGRGLAFLFQSPMPRRRLAGARALAILGFFVASDLVAAVLMATAVGFVRGDFEPAAAASTAIRLWGFCIVGDAVQLAFGVVASVYAPLPVVRVRRGGQARLGREGCLVLFGRALTLIPIGLVAAGVVALALAPGFLGGGPIHYAASGGAALLVLVALFYAGVAVAGDRLPRRETRILEALADTGE
ncbi:MAG TPA: hypothetical protein VEI02_10130 [Planctomycetota bacterium]|nr:hypothetical protein [Planctomycetota bacterium]